MSRQPLRYFSGKPHPQAEAVDDMVRSTASSVHRLASTPPSDGQSHDTYAGNSSTITRTASSSGSMACLRRHYLSTGLSENATMLLLCSWRASTNNNYDSAWNKWEVWCSDHHRHPLSTSVGSVVDFLADLRHVQRW